MGRKPRSGGRDGRDGRVSFAVGAEVEVRCDEEGFRGAWYEATVTRALPNRRTYAVVYASLVTDDDPSRPLRETVRASHLRPQPPRPGAGVRYSHHELVDAFHNDGWWIGVVSAALAGDRYTVSFPGSREVIDFSPSEIRPHLVWDHVRWSPPDDQAKERAKFAAGEQVEVSVDRENYGAAWFPGIVLKVILKAIYLVEYKKPIEDGNDKLLREIVDAQYVRSISPWAPEGRPFALFEEVEAFYHGGRLAGTVVNTIGMSKYIVKLMYWKEWRKEEQMVFHHSEMRIRRVWSNGSWVRVSKDKGRRRHSHAGKRYSLPISVSTSSSSDNEQLDKIILKHKRKRPSCEDQVGESQPCKKLMKGGSSDHLFIEIGPNTPTVETEVHAAMTNFHSPPSEFDAASHSVVTGLQQNLSFEELCNGHSMPEFNSGAELVVMGKESSNSKVKGSEQQKKASDLNNPLSSHKSGDLVLAIEWGNCKGVRGPRVNGLKRRKKLAIRLPNRQQVLDVDVRQHVKDEMKKRRGRPPKKSIKIIHMDASDTRTELHQPKKISNIVVESKERGKGIKLSNPDVSHDISNGNHALSVPDEVTRCENTLPTSDIEGDSRDDDVSSEQANKQVDKLVAHYSTSQMVSCARGDTSVKCLTAPQVSAVIRSSNNSRLSEIGIETENQAILPPLKDGSACATSKTFNTRIQEVSSFGNRLCAEGNLVDCMALSSPLEDGRAVIHEDHTPTVSPSKRTSVDKAAWIDPASSGSSAKTMPFVKSSPLWKTVESMETFHIMPQEPHFRQLEQYCMEFREGMAIGLMVTFTNLVASISKLRVFDSLESFEEKLKALASLEENGFEVQCIRSRMELLLEIRNNQRQFENKKATLKEQISERENEKDRLNELHVALLKTIMDMEQHLALFCKERDSVAVESINNEKEIAKLQTDVQATEEGYLFAVQRFDSITASPW